MITSKVQLTWSQAIGAFKWAKFGPNWAKFRSFYSRLPNKQHFLAFLQLVSPYLGVHTVYLCVRLLIWSFFPSWTFIKNCHLFSSLEQSHYIVAQGGVSSRAIHNWTVILFSFFCKEEIKLTSSMTIMSKSLHNTYYSL